MALTGGLFNHALLKSNWTLDLMLPLHLADAGVAGLGFSQGNTAAMVGVIKRKNRLYRVPADLRRFLEFWRRELAIPIFIPTVELLQKTDHLPLDFRFRNDRAWSTGARRKSDEEWDQQQLHKKLTLARSSGTGKL